MCVYYLYVYNNSRTFLWCKLTINSGKSFVSCWKLNRRLYLWRGFSECLLGIHGQVWRIRRLTYKIPKCQHQIKLDLVFTKSIYSHPTCVDKNNIQSILKECFKFWNTVIKCAVYKSLFVHLLI